jgi:hypothetical protein
MVRPAKTTPRPPATGLAVPGCYAAGLLDCGGRLSEEHYFSKVLMKAFARADSATSIRILRPGRHDRQVPPAAGLHEPVLCQRHNSALNDLDTMSARLFCGMREGLKLIPAYSCRAINGASLERWMLKVLCGSIAAEGKPVPLSWVRKLFAHEDIVAPCGLYMHVDLTKRHFESFGIELGAFRNNDGISGSVVRFDALRFTLDMAGQGRTVRPNEVGAARLLRPLGIWFEQGGLVRFYVLFDWGAAPASPDSLVVNVLDVGPPT